MLVLCIFATIIIGIVAGGYYWLLYTKSRFEYQKTVDDLNAKTTENALKLEIEKEKTKQEIEKRKVYDIKAEYRKEHGRDMY